MVGSEDRGIMRSKEAAVAGVGVKKIMALHDALTSLCLSSHWTYSVFWTIRPRPRLRGGYGSKLGDDNGTLMLMWEDGFCRRGKTEEDPVRKAFSKMSIQLYNYGEGLMGKVASDKCHKWVFKDPNECDQLNISSHWQSSFDSLPPEWNEQFDSGIQTIAVVQAGHGLLQLGSCKLIPEDLHFVLRMRQMFESLGYQSGFYLSHLFSSPQNPSYSVIAMPVRQSTHHMIRNSPHVALLPPSDDHVTGEEDDNDNILIKWPSGLSIFDAITGRTDDTKLMVNPDQPSKILNLGGQDRNRIDAAKLKRSFTLPSRIPVSSPSNPVEVDSLGAGDYRNEQGIYSDAYEDFP